MKEKDKQYWLEAKWQTNKDIVEILTPLLEQYGSLGCYEDMPLDEDPLKLDCELLSYFPSSLSVDELAKKLQKLETVSTKLITVKLIPQGNWATEWKKYFKPFFLTKNIVIRPSWEEYHKKANEKVLVLDPGMAFGTGQHDTTQFSASLIAKIKKDHPELKSLIDVGCGSGILSILAKMVGFETVTGFDVEDAAIETANENLDRNKEAKPINFFLNNGPINNLNIGSADVVVANIIAEVLVELSPDLINLVKPNGYLILSGILPQRQDEIFTAFKGLKLITSKQSDNWHAYLYHKQ